MKGSESMGIGRLHEFINHLGNMDKEAVLIIIVFCISCILLFLYYRFIYSRRGVLKCESSKFEYIPGPMEWEKQMVNLSKKHHMVFRMRNNFVLEDRKKIAHKRLNRIRNTISEISSDIISLIPSARWLFDNYQILYREVKKENSIDINSEMLPILKVRKNRGCPRIYVVAKKMVVISGGHLNEENVSIMLNAYQKEIFLTEEELVVLPGIIGFCLLEQVIEEADEIIKIIKIKAKADRFVKDKMLVRHGEPTISALLQKLDSNCTNNFSFDSHVIYLLKNMSFSTADILKYIHYQYPVESKYRNPANIFLEEGKLETQLESNIHGLIDSLRGINEADEQIFIEKYSYVESVLSKDPAGVYTSMDSSSRGMYRSLIIKLSRKYKVMEDKVARECLKLAEEGNAEVSYPNHVGTYLLGKGYPILKNKISNRKNKNYKKKPHKDIETKIKGFFYFLLLFIFFIFFCLVLFLVTRYIGEVKETYKYVLLLGISTPILLGSALEVTNHMFTRGTEVRKIPSLDYQKHIPDAARTYLVMPVLISTEIECTDYLARLKRHYLANKQENLYFALLVDFEDSKQKRMPKDEIFENLLIEEVHKLNAEYPRKQERFGLFIRERKWNESENCFMGWERKRGKLEEFNKLLYGCKKEETSYKIAICDDDLLNTFKYVITLDADSNLIRDNAAKLVGIIDHPLNQPIIDKKTGKIKEGYAIIQPSVSNHALEKKDSIFSEIFGYKNGISNYSFVVSDIYQDVFNEGVYVGKGIYQVEAFHQILHDAIPENRVLSHDLLESCYIRTAFASAVKILDVFPKTILSYIKREERWIRGDWQLLPWLFKGKNLNGVSKWKIFDNIRRSLVPFSKIIFIFLNLIFMPKFYFLWIFLVFFSDIFGFIHLLYVVVREKIKKPRFSIIYKQLWKKIFESFEKAILELVFNPYRAFTSMNAIVRTMFRLLISKKKLLTWNTAESVEKSVANSLKGYFVKMWKAGIPALILVVLLFYVKVPYVGMGIYILLAVMWAFSFLTAYYIRLPRLEHREKTDNENQEFLLEVARRTWRFFNDFSREGNGWLCPDNYQLVPQKKMSSKTSPTNIGLQLLTVLSARDFGFETLSEIVMQLNRIIQTIVNLPKWKGHLYNWYNIQTLEVLNPAYISTVDSGNFYGHLIALKNGLAEQMDVPILSTKSIDEFSKLIYSKQDLYKLKNSYVTIKELEIDLLQIKQVIEGRRKEEYNEEQENVYLKLNQLLTEIEKFDLREYSYSSCPSLNELADKNNKNAIDMIQTINHLKDTMDLMLSQVDFAVLFNEKRKLFHIGYHVNSQTMDAGCYDLMASESILTSYLAISRGEVQEKHWNKLGRLLTMVKGIPCFVSWSGTMFEYLMPKLVMREYSGTVFANTSNAAIIQQIKYAKKNKIPWGISESQYYRFDLDSNYQYKAFGVPKIRLKPSFKESLVVTPYATMLALSYVKNEAFANLRKLEKLGAFGMYGFYEAVDFDTNDPDTLKDYAIVKSFMAHHQGMIIVAINNFINQGIMRTRFHEEPIIKASESLLEEKIESNFILIAKRGYTIKTRKEDYQDEKLSNRYVNGTTPLLPIVNYLCNNRYSIMTTSDGDGFSKYMDRMIYRWRPDIYTSTGNYIYIKDVTDNMVWSATYSPTKIEPISYQAIFLPHQSEYKRLDGDIFTHTTVSLALAHDLEIRKVTLKNRGKIGKTIQLTSYMEVVGDTYLAELSHPAFNKLFIESEFIESESIFLSKRRTGNTINKPYLMHMVKSDNQFVKSVEYENDRLRFIGRNHSLENPDAVLLHESLSNTTGFSNDPIMSMRVNVFLKEGASVTVSFITGVCNSKEDAIMISQELSDDYRINDIFDQFRRQSDMELKYLKISRAQHNAYQDLISPIFYPSRYYRGPAENVRRNWKNQSFLWKFGVSGDIPIMLLRVNSIEEEGIIKDVLKAYEYLRINRVRIDLIILNESKYGYMDDLNDFLNEIISTLKIYDDNKEKKSLFIINAYQLNPAERDLLFTVSMVVFSEKTGIYFRNIREKLGDKLADTLGENK